MFYVSGENLTDIIKYLFAGESTEIIELVNTLMDFGTFSNLKSKYNQIMGFDGPKENDS